MRGFSLTELILVIGITAVLVTIGFINLVGHRPKKDLNLTTQEIVAALRNAQNRSISQESGNRWGVYFENPASGSDFYDVFFGVTYNPSSVDTRTPLRSDVQFTTPGPNSNITIIFAPLTGKPQSAQTIIISLVGDPGTSNTISINADGVISF